MLDRSLGLDAGAGSSATLTLILYASNATGLVPEAVFLDGGLACEIVQPVCSTAGPAALLAPAPVEAAAPSSSQVFPIGSVG